MTSGTCALHPGVVAEWTCQRCGTFVCRDCERRTRPDAQPLCPKCWELRERSIGKQETTDNEKGAIAGFVLGLVSVFHPLLMIASLIVNIRALIKKSGGARKWMHTAGLIATGVAMLIWFFGFLFIIFR